MANNSINKVKRPQSTIDSFFQPASKKVSLSAEHSVKFPTDRASNSQSQNTSNSFKIADTDLCSSVSSAVGKTDKLLTDIPLKETVNSSADLSEEKTRSNEKFHREHNDIAEYIGKPLDDATKYRLLESPWKPPDNYKFPFSIHNKNGKDEKRYLNKVHLEKYPWAVFSPSLQGIFCKYCPLFVTGNLGGYLNRIALQKLVTKPLTSFAKLTGKDGYLETHSKNLYHLNAVESAKCFIANLKNPERDIVNQIDARRMAQIAENRERLAPIIQTIVLQGRQNMALRGDNDDGNIAEQLEESPVNEGNFRELLRFRIQAGDKILEKHLSTASANATYISKTTQNELIQIIGEQIVLKILDQIKTNKFYSVVFDESTDISHTSQLSIVLRYLHVGKIREDFIQFVDCYVTLEKEGEEDEEIRLSGKALGQMVLACLKNYNADLQNCVGIGTDGCSVMTSEICGAVKEIQKEAVNAVRCPCFNHALNLSLSKSCTIQSIRNAVGVMKECSNFFSASGKRNRVFQKLLGHQVAGLCETRWVERHTTVLQFKTDLPKIVEALSKISQWNDISTSSKAKTLSAAVRDCEFIVAVMCLSEVLSITLPLSRVLQKETVEIDKASTLIDEVLNTMSDKREKCHTYFRDIFEDCEKVAAELHTDIVRPRITKRQTHRENYPGEDPEEYYRQSVYIPLLDCIIQDLKDRFSEETLSAFNLSVLVPNRIVNDKRSDTEIKPILHNLVARYHSLLNMEHEIANNLIKSEYTMWKRKWMQESQNNSLIIPTSAIESLDKCDTDVYPIINALLNILATLPVSVASAERTFSTLRRLKTWLRSCMTEERLNGLALMNIHRDISVNTESVIDSFARKKRRRMEFLL